ncbi:hypothetical protein Tco_1524572 [Tanacetum coccineum]
MEIPVHRVQVIESIQRDQGHKIVATSQTIPNIRSGATMTHEVVNELITRQVAEALEARDAARNLEPLAKGGDEQEDKNGDEYEGRIGGGNGNGGVNGNGNDNGNGGVNGKGNRGGNENGNGNGNGGGNGYGNHNMNFIGMEGVGLSRWFEKMETVFHISNCPQKYQVKYATCTLLNSALTWWNSHKRTIRVDATYAMRWTKLMKLMTKRFQELVLLYTRMVPDEEDKVERFIGGLPDNIQGNVIAAEPTRLQDAIRIANNLMDQKWKGCARNAENKIMFENNPRDNRGQQPSFKRQNVGGQNVARAYTAKNNEKKGYDGSLPYYNKCKLHHEGSCTMKFGNCKRVGHMTRDCTAVVATNTYRAQLGISRVLFVMSVEGQDIIGRIVLSADRSFVSSTFSALLDVAPSTLDTSYAVELADGRILETNLAKYHAVIIYDEKIIRIHYGDEVLIIRGDDCDSEITSKKTEEKLEEKRLEDVLIVREFSEVFPKYLPGLPPTRQVEFKIDLVHGVAPVARAPYQLAPTKMQELSTQLQELSDKGFIRPSSSP